MWKIPQEGNGKGKVKKIELTQGNILDWTENWFQMKNYNQL